MLKFLCLAFLVFSSAAYAQDTKDAPLEISASQTLEWRRNDKKFLARGDVVVRQGGITIRAAELIADYRASDEKSIDIHQLTATGGVTIQSDGNTATGDQAVYNVDTGIATMTGKNLKLSSPDQSVTARDKFEYNAVEGRLSAQGAAFVKRGEDTLAAERVAAVFANAAAGGARQLKEMSASGNVVITTPLETLRGDQGVYSAATNLATMTGNVKITRGPNVLEGEKAEVNLATNVSRMFGSAQQTNPTGGGRVRATFYPGSEKAESGIVPRPLDMAPPNAPAPYAAPDPAPAPASTPAAGAGVTIVPLENPPRVPPVPATPKSGGRLTGP